MPNRKLNEIPEYLRAYVVKQNASLYTWMDQASWRFILKLSRKFFKDHAHQKYLDGLRETGISLDRIPLIDEMSGCLAKYGWQAVAVSGFIPPGVFMEFLALGVLPIACDMRKIENLAYTPAPDIVHEAAGHAPIIADPDFAKYLLSYGELARKAIYSSQDLEVYNAIRALSDIKEDPASTPEQIETADERLAGALARLTYVSEATEVSRMGWWTFEYGLIGDLKNPKIYGAGLLSSMGESYHCLSEQVKKVPFSLECIRQNFDITKPQPQLFVAKDFNQLTAALEELASGMAFRRGGLVGLEKAKKAQTVTTIELNSGVQISGILKQFIAERGDDLEIEPAYLQFEGPTQLSYQDRQLKGQGADYHTQGYGTPVGVLADGFLTQALDEAALWKYGFTGGKKGTLKFHSGVELTGALKSLDRRDGKTLVIAFEDCTVKRIILDRLNRLEKLEKLEKKGQDKKTKTEQILFEPAWGVFDMVCGENIRSVFGGAADRKEYLAVTGGFHQTPQKPKTNLTAQNSKLDELYKKVRELREKKPEAAKLKGEFESISQFLDQTFPTDWLLTYEMLEVARGTPELKPFAEKAKQRLEHKARYDSSIDKAHSELILRGLEAL